MPEYFASRLKLFVALAPVTTVRWHRVTLLKFLYIYKDDLFVLLNLFNINQLLAYVGFANDALRVICSYKMRNVCLRVTDSIINSATEYDDFDRMAFYQQNYPNGISLRTVKHFVQSIDTGTFAAFRQDYSAGSTDIQSIDLSDIGKIAPIAFFYGEHDLVADKKDVLALKQLVQPVITKEIKGGHATFLIGKDMTYFTHDVM